MLDTERGDFGDVACSDCGDEGKGQVIIKHWGPLVPVGEVGYFCPDCWIARILIEGKGEGMRALGTAYEHRKHLMEDRSLISTGRDEMQKCGDDREKLQTLLEKINDAKLRFADSRQMFNEASRLRDIEREIQVRIRQLK